ncbi:MAG: MarR family transcriptional regulator [Actinomycetes bacterium]
MSTRGSGKRGPSSHAEETAFEREFPGASESANQSVIALIRASEAVVAVTNKAMRRHGLSAAGRQALAILEGAHQPLSPTTISERLVVTTASTTSLLDTLEKRGLITRVPDPEDRRKQMVTITAEGQRSVDEFLPEIVALQAAVMSAIGEPERTRLVKTLLAVREGAASVDLDEVVGSAPRRGPH